MYAESHKQVEERAAEWLAKRDSGNWSADDEEQYTRWIEASAVHRVALLRLEAAWDAAGRLKALGMGLAPNVVPPRGSWAGTPFVARAGNSLSEPVGSVAEGFSELCEMPRWRKRSTLAAAAGVLLCLASITVYFMSGRATDHYSTPIGQISTVPLEDGSIITLNTSSQVSVRLRSSERHVDLERGESFFVVAKDSRRPFVVQAGDKRVAAVGTRFSVRRDDGEVRVVVTEGSVRLETGHARTESNSTAPGFSQLTAGDVARTLDGDILIQRDSIGEAQELLSWRHGYLTFRETTLADAVSELNRYNRRQISIQDPRVAEIRISGTFRSTNYQAFVRLLEQGFAVHAIESEDTITLAAN
jgi:transmembrane sensor